MIHWKHTATLVKLDDAQTELQPAESFKLQSEEMIRATVHCVRQANGTGVPVA